LRDLPGFDILFVVVVLVVFVVLVSFFVAAFVEVVVFVRIVVEVILKLVMKRQGTHGRSMAYEAGSVAGLAFSRLGGG
jgi:hypothetical protein